MPPDAPALQSFADSIRTSAASSFYEDRWGDAKVFFDLPPTTRADLIATPLSQRRYKDEKALVKVVHAEEGLFASEWSFADIAKEDYGPIGMRPMVYLSEPDDAVEKSMWCYERNRLPLIGETMPEAANSAAEFYRIDSLIADSATLQQLLPHLTTRTEPLSSLVVIGASFDYEVLAPYARYAKTVTLVAALPETGAVAHAPLSQTPEFVLLPSCHLEPGVQPRITKLRALVTPLIRYEVPAFAGLQFAH